MTYHQFLDRNGVRLGLPDFSQVPYYLLIVGDPRQVPFKFQYGLDMTYAVGRLHFDTPEEYARSCPARSSNPRPSHGAPVSRDGSAFGTRHRADQATETSLDRLVNPLVEATERTAPSGWSIQRVLKAEATKPQLQGLLGGGKNTRPCSSPPRSG